jgi:ATP phosphoribosyltransferase regulatory subunit
MTVERWLLPEGVGEILPPQARALERARRDVLDLFERWGYQLVIPSMIEYLDSLLIGTGADLDIQTFKLTDQLTGRMMGVRADMTPQVARIDAHRLRREGPVRLCYLGTVLRTRPDGFAGSRSPMQLGAELYGHAGAHSDVEIVQLMVESLRALGITQEIHIDLGHVGIFRALMAHAGCSAQQESELFDALQRKARAEIQALLAALPGDPGARDMIAALIDLNGGEAVLAQARDAFRKAPRAVTDALDNLGEIAGLLQRAVGGLPIYYDLAELRGYQYQTGVVFAAYVPGHGQEVARGGRYDNIGKVFGRARPATGFSADLKTLLTLAAQPVAALRGIFAPASDDAGLVREIAQLRGAGERVVCALPGQSGDARAMECDRVLVKSAGGWSVKPVS